MSTLPLRHFLVWISIGIFTNGVISARAEDQIPEVIRDRNQTLQRILDFENEGKRLHKLEKADPANHRGRVDAYWNAAGLTALFVTYHVPDPKDLANLVQKFRMAYDLERADRAPAAAQAYRECRTHARFSDSGAVWDENGTEVHLSKLIDMRLAILGQKDPRSFLRRDQSEARSGVHVVFRDGGKVMLESIESYHLMHGDGFRPLTANESLAITARQGLLLLDRKLAISELKKGITKAGFDSQAKETNDLVVFAVARGPVPVNAVDQLADNLDAIRQGLIRKYFADRKPDPVPLVVYTGMGDELQGRNLSQAIHFRSQDEMEGYYEPLDHSIVLRKNCYFGDRQQPWVLGTASHELTHALIKPEFPDVPMWLDEGMASLQEEQDNNGPIDNYRLYFVKTALESQRLPAVEWLVDPGNFDWNDENAPLFWAMARYFCFYLESLDRSKNTLADLYRALRESSSAGLSKSTTMAILERATGKPASALEDDFRRFVAGRDVGSIEKKWGSLRKPAEEYLRDLFKPRTAQDVPPLATPTPLGFVEERLAAPPPPEAAPAPPTSSPPPLNAVAIPPAPDPEPSNAPPAPPASSPPPLNAAPERFASAPEPSAPRLASMAPPALAPSSEPPDAPIGPPPGIAPDSAPEPPSEAPDAPIGPPPGIAPAPPSSEAPDAPIGPPPGIAPPSASAPLDEAPDASFVPPLPGPPPPAGGMRPPGRPGQYPPAMRSRARVSVPLPMPAAQGPSRPSAPPPPYKVAPSAQPQYFTLQTTPNLYFNHGKPGTGAYLVLVPAAQVGPLGFAPQAATSFAPFSAPPAGSTTTATAPVSSAIFATGRPELSSKLSAGQLERFVIDAKHELQENKLDLSKARALYETEAMTLGKALTDWKSTRESFEGKLASNESDELLDIAKPGDAFEIEETRDQALKTLKSKIDQTRNALDLSVVRIRTLKKMIHSVESEIDDAEFLLEHKNSLESIGKGKSPPPPAPPAPEPQPPQGE